MPYYIEKNNASCNVGQWATTKEDGEVMGCHDTKQEAIDQAVAIAVAEESEFLGERSQRAMADELEVGDFVRWDSSGGTAQGQIERIVRDGQLDVPDTDFTLNATEDDPAALIRIFQERENDEGEVVWTPTDTLVGHRFSTLNKIEDLDGEQRQVDLEAPAYMRASARRGLEWYEAGQGGDGLVDATIREARAMARGTVTADKWTRIAAWIARHLVDLDAPAASPDHPAYPSPGVVAMALWGGGVNKRQATRAMEYAQGVVGRLAKENEGRATGEAVSKLETRVNATELEIRADGDGMTFEGYAAVFNSPSEPLPFIERIAPGAFKRTLRERSDIKLLWNHDTGQPLASTRSGTLQLWEDDKGLRVRAQLPHTQLGRDTAELVRTGVVDSMSFGFTVPAGGAEWNADGSERTLKSVRLFETSIVAFPAYSATAGTATVRGLAKLAQRASVDVDALADALLKLEAGENITEGDRELIDQVLDELAPKSEQADPEATETDDVDLGKQMLELKKKKLALLMGL